MSVKKLARRYVIHGRVQGVGYRWFVVQGAQALGLTGWVRNRDDGAVEVYAAGSETQLSALASLLWKGPRFADVHGVDESEAVPEQHSGFRVSD